jgi:hypothetical protein
MARVNKLLLSESLQPISHNKICGEDIRYTKLYSDIECARDSNEGMLYNLNGKALLPNWQKAYSLSRDAIMHHSKDLQLLLWLSESLISVNALQGILWSIDCLNQFCREFWIGMYPEDYSQRVALFDWYNEKFCIHLMSQQLLNLDKVCSLGEWMQLSTDERCDMIRHLYSHRNDVCALQTQVEKCLVDVVSLKDFCNNFLQKNKIDEEITFYKIENNLQTMISCINNIMTEHKILQAQNNISANEHITIDDEIDETKIDKTIFFDSSALGEKYDVTVDNNYLTDLTSNSINYNSSNSKSLSANIAKQNIIKLSKTLAELQPKAISTVILKQFEQWWNRDFFDLLLQYSDNPEELAGILKFLGLKTEIKTDNIPEDQSPQINQNDNKKVSIMKKRQK